MFSEANIAAEKPEPIGQLVSAKHINKILIHQFRLSTVLHVATVNWSFANGVMFHPNKVQIIEMVDTNYTKCLQQICVLIADVIYSR